MPETEGISFRLRQDGPIRLDLELACGPGQTLALVGPSGSGKTTILRSLAGLHRPAEAWVACGGRVWTDSQRGLCLPPRRRAVGMVFQSYALFPHLSAQANLMAAMDHLPRSRRAARARELLALVHLRGLEQRRPHQLSGGQQQRVAVARALARDPQVLLLDEPFSAVDRATREGLYQELAELRGKLRIPVLLVTHDLDEAAQLADRIGIIHHGRCLQVGPPAQIRTKPSSLEVARLVNLKNIFRATLAGRAQGRTLLAWRGRELRAALQDQFRRGDEVAWCVPSSAVRLVARDELDDPAGDNLLRLSVDELVFLGEMVRLSLALPGDAGERLTVTAPLYQVQQLDLRPGQAVTLALPSASIHLMPL
ncbi:MAG: ABC transporter ATP-binding protein [Thermodesulfobacteriota bacterium]